MHYPGSGVFVSDAANVALNGEDFVEVGVEGGTGCEGSLPRVCTTGVVHEWGLYGHAA